jgi:hypothetical protein
MPDDVRVSLVNLMALYFDENERAYLRASAAFGSALARSDWMSRMRGRPRGVGV